MFERAKKYMTQRILEIKAAEVKNPGASSLSNYGDRFQGIEGKLLIETRVKGGRWELANSADLEEGAEDANR